MVGPVSEDGSDNISHPICSFAVWLCYLLPYEEVEVIFTPCESRLASDLFWPIGYSRNDAVQPPRLGLKKSAGSTFMSWNVLSWNQLPCFEEAQEAMRRGFLEENQRHWPKTLAEFPVGMWMRLFWTFQTSQDTSQHSELELPDQPIETWEIINCSFFKPLYFGVVCNAAVPNWTTGALTTLFWGLAPSSFAYLTTFRPLQEV